MRRGEIRYADTGGPSGRRPVLIVTATDMIPVLGNVTCAPVTTTLRGITTRVPLGRREGLREKSEAACESLITISKSEVDPAALGRLEPSRFGDLDRALARTLDIQRGHLHGR